MCRDCCGSGIAWLRSLKGCVECKDWIDWRMGLKHYNNHCYSGHAKVKRKERTEDRVKNYINVNFKDFEHDQKLPTAHCNCNQSPNRPQTGRG